MTEPLRLYGDIWLGDKSSQLGDQRISLLEQIDALGSITQAARAVGISYKTAWDTVDAMKHITGDPLVESASGGQRGGGTHLTDAGRKLVETYRLIQREHRRFLANLGSGMEDFESFYGMVRRLGMKTSARNQFFGRVVGIDSGLINSRVEIALQGDDRIVATITHESEQHLGLQAGSEVWAMVKANWVTLTGDAGSAAARGGNRLCGEITRLTRGPVNSDVVLALPGGNTVSAIATNETIERLGLKKQKRACAVFKTSSVILGVAA